MPRSETRCSQSNYEALPQSPDSRLDTVFSRELKMIKIFFLQLVLFTSLCPPAMAQMNRSGFKVREPNLYAPQLHAETLDFNAIPSLSDYSNRRDGMNLPCGCAPVSGSCGCCVFGFFRVTDIEIQPAFEFTPMTYQLLLQRLFRPVNSLRVGPVT